MANAASAQILFQAGQVNFINNMAGGPNTEVVITHERSDSMVFRKLNGSKASVIATIGGVPFVDGTEIARPILSPNQKWAVTLVKDDQGTRYKNPYINIFFVSLDGKKTIQIDACQFIRPGTNCEFSTRNDKALYFDPTGKFALLEISSSPSNSYEWVDSNDQNILKIDLQSGLISKIYSGPLKLLPTKREIHVTNFNGAHGGFAILPTGPRFLAMVGIQGRFGDLTSRQQFAQLDLSNFSIKPFFASWTLTSEKNWFQQSSTLIHKQANIALVKLTEYELKNRNIIKTELRQVDFDKATSTVINAEVQVFDESSNLDLGWLVRQSDGLHAISFAGQNKFLAKADQFHFSEDGKYLATTVSSQPFSVTVTRVDGSSSKNLNVEIPAFFLQNLKYAEAMDIGYVDESSVGVRIFTASENVGWFRWFAKVDGAGTTIIDRAAYNSGRATERGEPSRYQGQICAYQEVNPGLKERATVLVDYSMNTINWWYFQKTEDKRRCRFKPETKSVVCSWLDYSGNGFVENLK